MQHNLQTFIFPSLFCTDSDHAAELYVQLRPRSSSSHESTGGSWSTLACVRFKSEGTAGPGARLRCAAGLFFFFFLIESYSGFSGSFAN